MMILVDRYITVASQEPQAWLVLVWPLYLILVSVMYLMFVVSFPLAIEKVFPHRVLC